MKLQIIASKRELRAVFIIWLFIFGLAVVSLLVLRSASHRIIERIEYVEAGTMQRVRALYEEADKYAAVALERYSAKNMNVQEKQTLATDDQDLLRALDLYSRALAMDPRGKWIPEHRKYHEILAHLYGAAGAGREQMLELAAAAMSSKQYQMASENARRLTSRDKKDYDAFKMLAEAELAMNRPQEVLSLATMVEATGGPKDLAAEIRGKGYLAQGKIGEAILELQQAVDLRPEDLQLRKQLADLYVAARKDAPAADVYKLGLQHGASDNANYMHLYGLTLLRLNRNAEAVEVLSAAERAEKHSAELYWDLARAYNRLHNRGKSDWALQQAVRLNPKLRDRVLEHKV